MRLAVTWLLVLLGACTPVLPSTEPLGSGPLAEEQEEDELPDRPRSKSGSTGSGVQDAGADVGGDTEVADGSESTEDDTTDAGDAGDAGDAEPGPISGDAAAASFVGEFTGTDVTTMRWEAEPEEKYPDPTASVRIESKSATEVTIVVIFTPTGGPFCSLTGTVNGNSADIAPGQTCPEAELNLGWTASVTSGKATLDGDQLVLEVEGDLEAQPGGDPRTGKFGYRFEGSR